jgi:hypothetical protein
VSGIIEPTQRLVEPDIMPASGVGETVIIVVAIADPQTPPTV